MYPTSTLRIGNPITDRRIPAMQIHRYAPPRTALGQVRPAAGGPMLMSLVGAALSAGTAWVGIRTGMKEKSGLLKTTGWVVGVAGALAGVISVANLVGIPLLALKPQAVTAA